MGTVCDGYRYEKTGFSMKKLRYKVAVIVDDKISCSRVAEKFSV